MTPRTCAICDHALTIKQRKYCSTKCRRLGIKKYKPADRVYSYDPNPEDYKIEPPKCIIFGCGRTLSPREHLFGNKCIKHVQPTATTLSIQ